MLPDGVYFGLSNEAYLAEKALGSSDLKDCLLQVVQWHGKKRNPTWMDHLRPKGQDADKESIYTAYGSALHCAVLEPDEFDSRYMIEPVAPDWPETIDQIRIAIQSSGNGHFLPSSKSAPKSHYEAAARAANVRTMADWVDEKRLMAEGRIQISQKWKFELLTTQRIIERHSKAQKWVTGGRSEVSVFWTEDGVRYKCRFDHLKIGRVCDIKSYMIKRGKTPLESFFSARDDFMYDFSATHYMGCRVDIIPQLVNAGAIFEVMGDEVIDGQAVVNFEEASPADMAFMDKVAAKQKPTWAWLACAKFGVPEVDVVIFPDDILAYSSALEQVKEAKRNYRKMRDLFGEDDEAMWIDDRGEVVLNDTNFSLRSTNRGARTYDTI